MSSFKDFLGAKDVKWWDGIARTFSRLTSTGGTLTQNKIGHMVDVLEVYGGGDTYTGVTIKTAVDAVGSNTCIFLLSPGTWVISSALTIPANVTLYVPHGTTISVSTSITLTINGPIMAGSYQIFDGAGTLGGTPILLWRNAQWFSGTITDSTTPSYKNGTGGTVTFTEVKSDTISEKTAATGVTIDGVKLKDSEPYCDVINEKTAAAGVTIDGLLIKDGEISIYKRAYDHGSKSGNYSLDMDLGSVHVVAFTATATLTLTTAQTNMRAIVIIKNGNNAITMAGIDNNSPTLTQAVNTQDFLMIVKSFGKVTCLSTVLNEATT